MSKKTAPTKEDVLLQKWIDERIPALSQGQWVRLIEDERTQDKSWGVFASLVEREKLQDVMPDYGWHLNYEDYCAEKKDEFIIFNNQIGSDKKRTYELSEDFRKIMKLEFDNNEGNYYFIDDSGEKQIITKGNKKYLDIRRDVLKQYLHIKSRDLVIQVDGWKHFQKNDIVNERVDKIFSDSGKYVRLICDTRSGVSDRKFSSVRAKVIVKAPESIKKTARKYCDFLSGLNDKGEQEFISCAPQNVAGLGNQKYLKPIHFRKEVLDKYHNSPEKFSVDPGILRCGYYWSLQIDNDRDECVTVALGDLGRDLPEQEMFHWKAYEIIPEQQGYSKTTFMQWFLNQPSETTNLPDVFRRKFNELNSIWLEREGWSLFLLLHNKDEHYFKNIRIPNNDLEFEEFSLALSKVIHDSINVKKINEVLGESAQGKSLSDLLTLLEIRGLVVPKALEQTLRDIQEYRSKGKAHRKGRGFDKTHARIFKEGVTVEYVGKKWLADCICFFKLLQESEIFDLE